MLKEIAFIVFILVVMMAASAVAPPVEGAVPRCDQPAMGRNEEVGYVLCCCSTSTGQCCAYTSYCTGFVPGCLCI
jgi:hypothetical protein